MPANINDKITKTFDTVNPNVAKVTADRAPGSTTLQANNLAGWTEVTAEHFSTYRVDAQNKLIEGSQTDWKGIVNKATNTITNLTRVGGAEDSGSLVNDIIQAGPTAKWADDLADGILVTHNADGTLKNKVAALTKINGGSTAGLLKSDASGNVTVGKATSGDLDYATLAFGNDSTTEVNTGFTTHDGKIKYKRTFTGTITASANNANLLIIAAPALGITNILDYNGWFNIGNTNFTQAIPAPQLYGRGGGISKNASNEVRLETFSDVARTNAPFAVTLVYTKD